MRILGLDPGTEETGYCLWDGSSVVEFGVESNRGLLFRLRDIHDPFALHHCALEMIASYGMPVGKETFETVLWIGRFFEALDRLKRSVSLVYRKDIKMHFCHSMKAKDGNVRQAIIDRFGGKDKAIGKKAAPGPLYGVSGHAWSALAIALYTQDTQPQP